MVKKIHICAYLLTIGDTLISEGRYHTISDIKGSYEHGKGIVIDVCTRLGWFRLFPNEVVEVYRYV